MRWIGSVIEVLAAFAGGLRQLIPPFDATKPSGLAQDTPARLHPGLTAEQNHDGWLTEAEVISTYCGEPPRSR